MLRAAIVELFQGDFAADAVTASRHFAGLCQSGAFQRLLIGAGGKPKSAQVKEEIDAAVDAFMRAYGT